MRHCVGIGRYRCGGLAPLIFGLVQRDDQTMVANTQTFAQFQFAAAIAVFAIVIIHIQCQIEPMSNRTE